ncbi:MFS transporter [Petropleomorpha daqingensis]|uniref:CP family cyanate transporter-like MFS transporter n=1 Tax=Petropleomorpha daqingensis TaxID=2026353 RepID=A0A853CL61_9ACTN|nr:MFS transporter [Petropleomorpha daqingensis]NYJ08665.1 CP family cyanate transporter-like MFS transporter [Petropleomorpha daqingensis]
MNPAPPRATGMLLAGVLLAGLNLRLSIAAVSPVLPEIRADLHLSATVAGLLTTLPVLCFAGFAPVAAWFGRRVGAERAILLGLVLLGAATALRVLDGAPVLLAGTVLLGAAMAVGNVLLPAVVKRDFGPRAGTVTGLYTATFTVGAAATAALTAPLAAVWGWRAALGCWAVLAVVAVVVWALATRGDRGVPGARAAGPSGGPRVWRSGLAWAVSTALMLQTGLYYAVTAWLPSLLVDELGRGGAAAGASAGSLFQSLGIPGTLIVPLVVRRSTSQRGLGLVVAAGWAVLVVGLLVAPAAWPVWAVVGGIAQGAGLALAFTLVVLRSADEEQARQLSGMGQLVGYGGGALAPLAVGALYAVGGSWTLPLGFLVVLVVVQAAVLFRAGRPGTLAPLSERTGPEASPGS